MGSFIDLVDSAIQGGTQALIADATGKKQTLGTSAHIEAQNQTVAQFGTIINQFNAGQLSASAAAALIQRYDSGFSTYCQTLGYARALQGAQDVHNLALRVIASFGVNPTIQQPQPAGTTAQTVVAGQVVPVTSVPVQTAGIGGLLSSMSPTTLVLVGVLAYMMFSRKSLF